MKHYFGMLPGWYTKSGTNLKPETVTQHMMWYTETDMRQVEVKCQSFADILWNFVAPSSSQNIQKLMTLVEVWILLILNQSSRGSVHFLTFFQKFYPLPPPIYPPPLNLGKKCSKVVNGTANKEFFHPDKFLPITHAPPPPTHLHPKIKINVYVDAAT